MSKILTPSPLGQCERRKKLPHVGEMESLVEGQGVRGKRPVGWVKRFWKKILKTHDPEDCWIWTGERSRDGYGKLCIGTKGKNRKQHYANRLSWILHNGPIPPGLFVLHDCPTGDNPSCVNPNHLFLGTIKDNGMDAAKKGLTTFGVKNAMAKLNDKKVSRVRRLYAFGGTSYSKLGKAFGVSKSLIHLIVQRRIWKRTA